MTVGLILLSLVVLAVEGTVVDDFITGNRKFTGDLYNDAATWSTSTFGILLSPLSIQTLMAMAQSGAEGVTGEEIRSGLSLLNTTGNTETAIHTILSNINAKLSNKIYVEKDFTTNDNFKSVASEAYQATFEDIDFFVAATAGTTINSWVGEQTNNRFGTNFAKAADFTKLTKDFLINTLFMAKNWSSPFSTANTKTERFYYGTASSAYDNVPVMTQTPSLYNYYESEELEAKFLEIPFNERNATFTIVLPNNVTGLANLESQIEEVLRRPDYTEEFIQLSLPKCTIQLTYVGLTGTMGKLGIEKAFSNSEADFSGISGVPGGLQIYNVRHNTYINIDENGVEAVAAGPADLGVPSTKNFNAYYSFIFYIKVDGVVVFVGKVTRPTYTKNN